MEETSKQLAHHCSSSVRLSLLRMAGVLALVSLLGAGGCAGSLDPSQFQDGGTAATGSGGTSSSGGTTGNGGTTGSGGSGTGGMTGSGGTNGNCTGNLMGAAIITAQCATSGCHASATASVSGAGLDLTTNSTIGARLVGVVSPGDSAASSQCGGNTTPYLNAGSNPATGLLIEKFQQSHPPCGFQMPFGQPPLSAMQQTCLVEWATTLTSSSQ
jgi:hypothetical protein